MKVWGNLERAQLEVLASNPAALIGRVFWNSTDGRMYVSDASQVLALLRNDDKLVIGTSGTATENTRIYRAGDGVLQLTDGSDATAEGTPSTSVDQLIFRHENLPTASLPAAGNAGRIIWDTTLGAFVRDNGTTIDALVPQATVGTPSDGDTIVYDGTAERYSTPTQPGIKNISFEAVTTTQTNDTLKITSADGTPLSSTNRGYVTMQDGTVFAVTADVTIQHTVSNVNRVEWSAVSATFNKYPASIYAINDSGTLRWGLCNVEGLTLLESARCFTTPSSVNIIGHTLTDSVVSGDSVALEVGWVMMNYSTGTSFWQIDNNTGDINVGPSPSRWRPAGGVITWGVNGSTTNPTIPANRATDEIYWIKDGQNCKLRYHYKQNVGGTAGSGTYIFLMPSGIVMDGTRFPTGADRLARVCGYGNVSTTVEGRRTGIIYDQSNQGFEMLYDAAGGNFVVGSSTHPISDVSFRFSFTTFSFPVSYWR